MPPILENDPWLLAVALLLIIVFTVVGFAIGRRRKTR